MRVRLGGAQASSEQPEDSVRSPPLLSPCYLHSAPCDRQKSPLQCGSRSDL
jgi:hypothetical protein